MRRLTQQEIDTIAAATLRHLICTCTERGTARVIASMRKQLKNSMKNQKSVR